MDFKIRNAPCNGRPRRRGRAHPFWYIPRAHTLTSPLLLRLSLFLISIRNEISFLCLSIRIRNCARQSNDSLPPFRIWNISHISCWRGGISLHRRSREGWRNPFLSSPILSQSHSCQPPYSPAVQYFRLYEITRILDFICYHLSLYISILISFNSSSSLQRGGHPLLELTWMSGLLTSKRWRRSIDTRMLRTIARFGNSTINWKERPSLIMERVWVCRNGDNGCWMIIGNTSYAGANLPPGSNAENILQWLLQALLCKSFLYKAHTLTSYFPIRWNRSLSHSWGRRLTIWRRSFIQMATIMGRWVVAWDFFGKHLLLLSSFFLLIPFQIIHVGAHYDSTSERKTILAPGNLKMKSLFFNS